MNGRYRLPAGSELDRRHFIAALSVATLGAVGLTRCYTVDTLWSGSLEDHGLIPASEVVKMANRYFNPQAIVIGHLNHLPVTEVYDQLVDVIRSRKLRTVTLDDVFLKPEYGQ